MKATSITDAEKGYVTTNQVIRGVLDYIGAGRFEEAARLYSHCQEDIGYLLISKTPRERAVQTNLAKMFFLAKDFEKAAQILEGMGESRRAAELYERTDQYDQAAEMWAREGELERAAQNYEKSGRWQTAADLYTQVQNFERAAFCFEKLVNHFLAGKYYFQLKRFQKSMDLLQKVREDEDHYLDAAVMIGNILAMHGYLDMAVAKYKVVTRTVPLAKGSLSVYYNLAQLLERKGEVFEAMKMFKEAAGVDPDYRDVSARIRELEKRMAERVEISEPAGEEVLEVIEDLEPVEEVEAAAASRPGVMAGQARIVSVMEGFEFLKNTSLFDRLSLSEMKQLYNITNTRQCPPGELVIEQDQPGQALFIVKRGQVIVQRVEGDKISVLVELGPGAHVGEMSLVDQAPTSARVVAGPEGAELFEITRDQFESLIASDDKIAVKVFRVFAETFCQRLRRTTAELSALKAGAGSR